MKVMRSGEPVLFFSKKEKEEIVRAIQEAEMNSSAEIRVHLERRAKPDILAHAGEVFEKLGMGRTKDRNGVLIFLGVRSRRFAIIGDGGINEKVPPGFWDGIAGGMAARFREDRFAEGIAEGIRRTGEELKKFFPYRRENKGHRRNHKNL